MKKILVLLVFVTLSFGCSIEDNSTSESEILNPPEWLIGSWEYKIESITMSELEVTSDNVKLILGIGTVYDIAGQVKAMESAPNGSVDIEEAIISNDFYEFTMTIYVNNAEQLRTTYGFELIDSETINFSQNSAIIEMKKI